MYKGKPTSKTNSFSVETLRGRRASSNGSQVLKEHDDQHRLINLVQLPTCHSWREKKKLSMVKKLKYLYSTNQA